MPHVCAACRQVASFAAEHRNAAVKLKTCSEAFLGLSVIGPIAGALYIEASEEVRLEEINFYNARARAEPVMQELLGKTPGCKAVDNSRC